MDKKKDDDSIFWWIFAWFGFLILSIPLYWIASLLMWLKHGYLEENWWCNFTKEKTCDGYLTDNFIGLNKLILFLSNLFGPGILYLIPSVVIGIVIFTIIKNTQKNNTP